MTTDLQIRLLGGLHVSQGDVAITGFVSTKVAALLAHLAVTRRAHQRHALATLLWGEMDDASAANNLRQALSNLRKLVDPYLLIARETVQFSSDLPVSLDVAIFEQALLAAHSQPLATRTTTLQCACNLYQGDFLAGVIVRDAPDFDEWLLAQRVRLREQAIHALHTLGDLYLAQAMYDRALDCAMRLLALDSWRESAHRQMMLALAHSGQRVAALSQYETCRRILAVELGVQPSEETTALAARIRVAGATPRHNLPPPVSVVGRAEEMAAINLRLLHTDCRLLTLTGAGGMGKTRLALYAAQQAHQRGLFLDGVFWVELITATTVTAFLSAIASALGLQMSDGKPMLVQLLAYLRAKEALLVLDNFDYLLGESGAVRQILQQAPQVKLLITSREALNLQSEWYLPITGLPYPPPGVNAIGVASKADAVEAFASVQLFLARAHAVRPNFVLDNAAALHVAAICRYVEGMPLGIELAAAQLRHYECSEIAAAIDRNLDFLATSYRDAAPHHGSLRAVFDFSWGLLSPTLQATFTALSVFAGSFRHVEALEVAGATRSALNALLDKSLLHRAGPDRYILHELLRLYAASRLSGAAADAALTAHSRVYCRLLAEQSVLLKNAAQKTAVARIAQDYENVRAAWRTAVAAKDIAALLTGMDGLFHFYMVRSRFQEGADLFGWTRQALTPDAARHDAAHLNTANEPRRLFVHLAVRQARFYIMLSRHTEARELLAPCLAELRSLEDYAGVAAALVYLGAAATSLGDYEQAQTNLQESLDLRSALADDWGQAVCHLELAGLAFYRGDNQKAGAHCAEGLRLVGPGGDPQILAHLLTGSSIVARQLGDYRAAQEFIARSLSVYEEMEDSYGVIQGWLTLGGLACSLAQYHDAAAHYQRALGASLTLGFRSGEAECHCRLGQIAAAQGQSGEAVTHFQIALRLTTEIQEAPLIFDTLYAVATLNKMPLPAVAPLATWLLAQPELDPPRRVVATAILAATNAETILAPPPDDHRAAVAVAQHLLYLYSQSFDSRLSQAPETTPGESRLRET